MAQTTLSGSTVRHNGGSVLGAGAITGRTKNLSLITSLHQTVYSSFANETNARVGTATRPLSTGTYAVMARGKYIAKFLTSGVIAGVSNSVIDLMARAKTMKTVHKLQSARRYDNTSWTMQGVLTKGAAAGNSYDYIDAEAGDGTTAAADSGSPVNEWSVNGELFFLSGGKVPVTASYSVRKG